MIADLAGARSSGDWDVYGAITYYLAHRGHIDRYLEERQHDFDVKWQAARDADPMFYQKLASAKKQTSHTR